MTEIKSLAVVKDGVLKHIFPVKFGTDVKALRDGEYSIHIKRNGKRSQAQMGYLWAVVYPMITAEFNRLGNDVTTEITHLFLKQKFLPKEIHDADGIVLETVAGTTSTLDKYGMMEYLDKCIHFAASVLSINIPAPTTLENNYFNK